MSSSFSKYFFFIVSYDWFINVGNYYDYDSDLSLIIFNLSIDEASDLEIYWDSESSEEIMPSWWPLFILLSVLKQISFDCSYNIVMLLSWLIKEFSGLKLMNDWLIKDELELFWCDCEEGEFPVGLEDCIKAFKGLIICLIMMFEHLYFINTY